MMLTFFLILSLLFFMLLAMNLASFPHNPYQEKHNAFECGFHSFLGQNKTRINLFVANYLFLVQSGTFLLFNFIENINFSFTPDLIAELLGVIVIFVIAFFQWIFSCLVIKFLRYKGFSLHYNAEKQSAVIISIVLITATIANIHFSQCNVPFTLEFFCFTFCTVLLINICTCSRFFTMKNGISLLVFFIFILIIKTTTLFWIYPYIVYCLKPFISDLIKIVPVNIDNTDVFTKTKPKSLWEKFFRTPNNKPFASSSPRLSVGKSGPSILEQINKRHGVINSSPILHNLFWEGKLFFSQYDLCSERSNVLTINKVKGVSKIAVNNILQPKRIITYLPDFNFDIFYIQLYMTFGFNNNISIINLSKQQQYLPDISFLSEIENLSYDKLIAKNWDSRVTVYVNQDITQYDLIGQVMHPLIGPVVYGCLSDELLVQLNMDKSTITQYISASFELKVSDLTPGYIDLYSYNNRSVQILYHFKASGISKQNFFKIFDSFIDLNTFNSLTNYDLMTYVSTAQLGAILFGFDISTDLQVRNHIFGIPNYVNLDNLNNNTVTDLKQWIEGETNYLGFEAPGNEFEPQPQDFQDKGKQRQVEPENMDVFEEQLAAGDIYDDNAQNIGEPSRSIAYKPGLENLNVEDKALVKFPWSNLELRGNGYLFPDTHIPGEFLRPSDFARFSGKLIELRFGSTNNLFQRSNAIYKWMGKLHSDTSIALWIIYEKDLIALHDRTTDLVACANTSPMELALVRIFNNHIELEASIPNFRKEHLRILIDRLTLMYNH